MNKSAQFATYISEEKLEDIYEYTYKYSWLDTKEREEGWLPDRAYMAKARIGGKLESLLDDGLDALKDCYKDWLSEHTRDGWASNVLYSASDGGDTGDIRTIVDIMNFWVSQPGSDMDIETVKDIIFRFTYEQNVNREEMIAQEDYDFLKEQYGQAFLDDTYENLTEEQKEFWDDNNPDAESFFSEFDSRYEFEKPLIDWVVKETDYLDLDYFLEAFGKDYFLENFPLTYNQMEELLKEELYDLYLNCFPGLEEEIADIENMYNVLTQSQGDIKEKIVTFQLGLTTAHHHGTMVEHLLEMGEGEGKKFLDELSNKNVDEWNSELESYMGYQSEKKEEPKRTYYEPELGRHLSMKAYWVDEEIEDFRGILNKIYKSISHTVAEENIMELARKVEEELDFMEKPVVYEGPEEVNVGIGESALHISALIDSIIEEIANNVPEEEYTNEVLDAVDDLEKYAQRMKNLAEEERLGWMDEF